MVLAWRFSRTFASRFNFANVVFFLPAKVDLQVARANRGPGRHDGDALSSSRAGGRATSPGKASHVHTERASAQPQRQPTCRARALLRATSGAAGGDAVTPRDGP